MVSIKQNILIGDVVAASEFVPIFIRPHPSKLSVLKSKSCHIHAQINLQLGKFRLCLTKLSKLYLYIFRITIGIDFTARSI